jgi:hypothetical protein
MRYIRHRRALRLATHLLGIACGVVISLVLFAHVAAGHRYHRFLPPTACYHGCFYHGLYYYYHGGLWYCYTGGQWYYFDPCWHTWDSLGDPGGAIQSANGW